jgi:transposase-like protein
MRGGREAASMLTVAGREAEDDKVRGGSVLDEIAREGARRMLLAALETEVTAYLQAHAAERDGDGHALVVRNGKGRTRHVTVGSGTIAVNAPRVNDRRVDANGHRRKFTSRILPPYMRRSPKVAEVLPVLYLRGLSTGDFREALVALLGEDAAGLSATNRAADQRVGERVPGFPEAEPSPTATTCTSGSTACTSTSAWRTTGSARWS